MGSDSERDGKKQRACPQTKEKTLNCQQRTVYGERVFLTTKEVCRDSTMQLLPYIAIWRGQREDFAT